MRRYSSLNDAPARGKSRMNVGIPMDLRRASEKADCLLERAGFELPRPLVVKADF